MSNVVVTHAPSGLVHAHVLRRAAVTPHLVRVTIGGDDLRRFEYRGFDQWFRLAVPVRDTHPRFDNLPDRFDMGGYLRYLALPKHTRPVIRNYTVRGFRPDGAHGPELDIDFVVHGADGIAAPWAASAEAGDEVAFIDQGCGWRGETAEPVLLIGDESALPAVAGILRDLPRDVTGTAIIELFDAADRQEIEGPAGVDVLWVTRSPDDAPGTEALAVLRDLVSIPADVTAFAAGESGLATGARRHLVGERGIPKSQVTFCGYWKAGKAAG
ncbi:MAG: siderophore-interacting protein [Schumannella sp.]